MFSFLNSAYLLGALAALIPLLIHLFSKRRVKVVEFSSLKHLKAMQRRQVRRLKIRQLLLLILRMAIILCLVLAFARPTLQSGSIGSHAAVSAVVLFDNSASMDRYVGDGKLFDIARQQAEAIVNTFGDDDQVAVLPLAAAEQRELGFRLGSAAKAEEQLENIELVHRTADLLGGLEKAGALLREAENLVRELYIVTDRQRINQPELTLGDLDSLVGANARLALVDLPIETDGNLGVVDLDLGGEMLLPGHEFDLKSTVKNYDNGGRTQLVASLFLDGHRVSQRDLIVDGGQEAEVVFTRSVTRTGFHSGWVELSDDKLDADNRHYFSFYIPEQFNILVIEGSSAGRLISLALVPDENLNQHWSVKKVGADDLVGVNFRDYDAVVLAGAPRLAGNQVRRLKSYVRAGRPLMVTYSALTEGSFFNAELAELTGVTIEEGVPSAVSRAGFYTLDSYDPEHPILEAFQFTDGKLPLLKFYGLPKVAVGESATSIMQFSGNRPALVESEYDKGKVLTFLGPVEPTHSDIAGHAFFVAFTSRMVEYLTSSLSVVEFDRTVGERVVRRLDISDGLELAPVLIAPDSSERRIPIVEEAGRVTIALDDATLPGIYRVTHLGREVDRFALNLPTQEGTQDFVELDQLAAAVGASEFQVLEKPTQIATVIGEMRFGKELWSLFLWLAAILLAIEMLLARSKGVEESA